MWPLRPIAGLALLTVVTAAPGGGWAQSRYVGNDVVVKYRASATKSFASPQAFARAKGLPFKKRGQLPRTAVVQPGSNPDAVVARLQQDPDVEYATRDHWIQLAATIPND